MNNFQKDKKCTDHQNKRPSAKKIFFYFFSLLSHCNRMLKSRSQARYSYAFIVILLELKNIFKRNSHGRGINKQKI